LDMQDVVALENPDKHTVHCLIDPPPCSESPYEILMDPPAGESTWIRAYTLDDASKDMMVSIIKRVGKCDLCTGEGELEAGFRAKMTITVVGEADAESGAGPLVSVMMAEPILPTETYMVGDIVNVEGFVMDYFCIQLGVSYGAETVAFLFLWYLSWNFLWLTAYVFLLSFH
jgi:hypothetical protein